MPNDPFVPTAGLGSFVNGYDSSRDSKPIGSTVTLVLLAMGMLALSVFFAFFGNDDTSVKLLLGLLFLFFAGLFLFLALKPWFRVNRVYVYDNGFFWTTENRKGKTVKEAVVDFNQVKGVMNRRTRQYKNGVYTGTDYHFTVIGKDGLLFEDRGSYRNQDENPDDGGWRFFALQSILQQWMKIGVDRMNEELRTKGFISFDDIAVSKDYIRKGDVTIERGDIVYKLSGGSLTVDRASKEKKILNVKHDININVNCMVNGQWFLYAVKNLLGIV